MHKSPPFFFLHWAKWIESTPSQTISIVPFLIVCYHLRLCLPSGLFPFDFPTKSLLSLSLSVSLSLYIYIQKPTFYMHVYVLYTCVPTWDVRSLKYGAWCSAVEHTIPLTSTGSITKFYSSRRWIQILEWLAKPRYTYILSIVTCCYFQGRAVSLSKPNSHLHIMSWTSSCRRSKRKKLCGRCQKRYSRERASWRP